MAGVASTHPTYDDLKDRWQRCRDTVSGTDAVKGAGTKYLPMLDSHHLPDNSKKYDAYVKRALFYNATGRTVDGLAGGIFQKAPAVSEINDVVKEHVKDITLTGQPIDMFALNVTKEYLTTGRFGVLIDMAGEEATTPRPYWVGYVAEDIINWKFEKMGGDQELSLVVLRECIDDPTDPDEFCKKQLSQLRVLRLTNGVYTQQLYIEIAKDSIVTRGSTGDTYGLSSNGKIEYAPGKITTPLRRGQPLDFIPFALPWNVPTPPLIDLVDVNLSHYRGYADLKHGLHFTALPTPWVSGLTGTELGKPLAMGAGTAWQLDVNGKAGMLEFTGKGLESIRKDLQDMQRMMATLGARLLEEAPHYAETALSVSLRHSSDYATLRTIAQIVEQQLSWALKVHVWWLGTEALVTDLKANIELNKIFFDQQLTADELRALLLALQSKSISFKTFYARLSATGWTREGIDEEEELKDISEQDPLLGVPPPKPGTNPEDPGGPKQKDGQLPNKAGNEKIAA